MRKGKLQILVTTMPAKVMSAGNVRYSQAFPSSCGCEYGFGFYALADKLMEIHNKETNEMPCIPILVKCSNSSTGWC